MSPRVYTYPVYTETTLKQNESSSKVCLFFALHGLLVTHTIIMLYYSALLTIYTIYTDIY